MGEGTLEYGDMPVHESRVRNGNVGVVRDKLLVGNNGGVSLETMVEVRRNAQR